MKLADLKKLSVGTKLRLVKTLLGPCDKAREVVKVSAANLQLKGEGVPEGQVSYLPFLPAKGFRDDGDGFSVLQGGEVAAQYKFVG